MKIQFTLHDMPGSDAGGMGVTMGLTEVYRRLGDEVDLLCFGDLPTHLPPQAKAVLFPLLVATRLRASDADVIDAAIGDAWVLGKARGPAARSLLVCRSHGMTHRADKAHREEAARGTMELSWKYPLYWGGLRLHQELTAMRRSDLCLFLNDEERRIAVEELGIPERKVRLVDNGLPPALIGRPLPSPPPTLTEAKIAHIGSYLPHKGIHYLIEALESVFARHPRVQATLLGTGADSATVLADFEPAYRDRIEVVPAYSRHSLPDLLADHAIVISASLREGFPLGTLEAMACGLVPVISDIAGPTQYVHDEENGLVVEAASAAALDAGVERLLGDPDLFAKLRAEAHTTAQRYSWDRVGGETLDLYGEALERVRSQGR